MSKVDLARTHIHRQEGLTLPVPKKSYILCSSPRSGTYMFAGIMRDLQLGDPYEAFNSGANRRYRPYYDVADFFILVSRVLEKQTSIETGVFGVKFFWEHLERFIRNTRKYEALRDPELSDIDLLEIFFGSPFYIYLRRRDLLKQAVSLARALQSNHFQTIDDTPDTVSAAKAVYDADLISRAIMCLLSEALLWRRFFCEYGIQPFEFWFEDLVVDRIHTMRAVLNFLGEKTDHVPEPHTIKLSDHVNRNWCRRYKEENPWLEVCDIEQLISSGECVDILARLTYHYSLKGSQNKGALFVRMQRLANSLRWRLGVGNFG